MKLCEYEGKKVRIFNKFGQVFVGLADIYSCADDNESGVASILFVSDDGSFLEIEEPEILKIEIIGAATHNLLHISFK